MPSAPTASLRIVLLLELTLGACASRQRADELSAAEHRRAAERERDQAMAEVMRDSAPVASGPLTTGVGHPGSAAWLLVVDERGAAKARAFDHLAHAAEHDAMANALEGFESTECGAVAPKARAACPFLSVASVEDLPNGVRLRLGAPDTRSDVLAEMRCHLAFAHAHGKLRAPDCPLYIGGVDIVGAPNDAGAIDLVASSPAIATELRRRAHADVR
jgi:hypothetical protein